MSVFNTICYTSKGKAQTKTKRTAVDQWRRAFEILNGNRKGQVKTKFECPNGNNYTKSEIRCINNVFHSMYYNKHAQDSVTKGYFAGLKSSCRDQLWKWKRELDHKFRKFGLQGHLYKGLERLAFPFLHRRVVFSAPDPLGLGESCLLVLREDARSPLLEASQVAIHQTAAS